jgi:hypothetical protein
MAMQRFVFNVSTDTGTSALQSGDTGKPVFGEIRQLRWNPTSVDTGGDLYVALLPKEGDSGDGFQIFSKNDILGANFTRLVSQQTVHIDNFDTGSTTEMPFVAAGERLRIKVLPGQGECRGRLYVYVKD